MVNLTTVGLLRKLMVDFRFICYRFKLFFPANNDFCTYSTANIHVYTIFGYFQNSDCAFLHRMWRSSWMCWIKLHRLEVCILTEKIKICESKCKGMNVAAPEHRRQHSFTATQALFQKELIENEREMLDRMMNEWMNKYTQTNGDR